jgi:hypothetical protein
LLFGVFGISLARHRWRGQRLPWTTAAIGLIPLGSGLYATLLYSAGHHPLAFIQAQGHWGRGFTSPFTTLSIAFGSVNWASSRDMKGMQHLANALCAFLFLCLGFVGLFRTLRARCGLEVAQPLYVFVGVLLPLCTGKHRFYGSLLFCLIPRLCNNGGWLVKLAILLLGNLRIQYYPDDVHCWFHE